MTSYAAALRPAQDKPNPQSRNGLASRPFSVSVPAARPGAASPESAGLAHRQDNISIRPSVVQRYPYLKDAGREASQIYGIYQQVNETVGDTALYVGQTTIRRAGERWQEHVKLDDWAPWYASTGKEYLDVPEKRWPYVPREIWHLPGDADTGVTKMETTAAEQYCYEALTPAWNREAPLLKATFLKYKNQQNPVVYKASNAHLMAGWTPSR